MVTMNRTHTPQRNAFAASPSSSAVPKTFCTQEQLYAFKPDRFGARQQQDDTQPSVQFGQRFMPTGGRPSPRVIVGSGLAALAAVGGFLFIPPLFSDSPSSQTTASATPTPGAEAPGQVQPTEEPEATQADEAPRAVESNPDCVLDGIGFENEDLKQTYSSGVQLQYLEREGRIIAIDGGMVNSPNLADIAPDGKTCYGDFQFMDVENAEGGEFTVFANLTDNPDDRKPIATGRLQGENRMILTLAGDDPEVDSNAMGIPRGMTPEQATVMATLSTLQSYFVYGGKGGLNEALAEYGLPPYTRGSAYNSLDRRDGLELWPTLTPEEDGPNLPEVFAVFMDQFRNRGY